MSALKPANDEIISVDKKLYKELPKNIEAEQALLGALLINNELLHKVADFLQSTHFFEPAHQKIYQQIFNYNEKSLVATPITLKGVFDKDEVFKELGGAGYLVRLAAAATEIIDIKTYGLLIYDLALKRQLIDVGGDIVNQAYDESNDNTAEGQIEKAESRLFGLATDGSKDGAFAHLKIALGEAVASAEEAKKRGGGLMGISTSLADIDEKLGGFQDSDLLILAGRPSMGKTALAINFAFNCAENLAADSEGGSVGVFSLEMSAEQLAMRMLSSATGLNATEIRRGELDDAGFAKLVEANDKLAKLPLHIDDTPALSISAIRTRARRLKRKHNLKLLVIDYLQLIRGSARSAGEGRTQEVSEITQGLKAIAKELNIPVIALSQLSRAVEQREDKRPQLSDLRESGSIEQDADIVMFIYREEYYLARKMPQEGTDAFTKWQEDMNRVRNLTEVIVAKQRNGPIGKVDLLFEINTTTFKNYVKDEFY